jgi:hypothetical protein
MDGAELPEPADELMRPVRLAIPCREELLERREHGRASSGLRKCEDMFCGCVSRIKNFFLEQLASQMDQ